MPISTIGQNGLQQSRILTAVQQPAGAVLQVLQATTNSTITTTSSSPQQSGLTITVTPTSSSSKFLLMLNGGNSFNDASGREIWFYWGRNINSAGYTVLNSNQQYGLFSNQSAVNKYSTSVTYLDSPATSSQIVYQPYFSTNAGVGTAYFNQGTIAIEFTLMEIAA